VAVYPNSILFHFYFSAALSGSTREVGNTRSHKSRITSTNLVQMFDTDFFPLYRDNSHFGHIMHCSDLLTRPLRWHQSAVYSSHFSATRWRAGHSVIHRCYVADGPMEDVIMILRDKYRVAQKKTVESLMHRHFATVRRRITRFASKCSEINWQHNERAYFWIL